MRPAAPRACGQNSAQGVGRLGAGRENKIEVGHGAFAFAPSMAAAHAACQPGADMVSPAKRHPRPHAPIPAPIPAPCPRAPAHAHASAPAPCPLLLPLPPDPDPTKDAARWLNSTATP
jgi:hypothetical protein